MEASELVSINELLTKVEKIGWASSWNVNTTLTHPKASAGRNSDNTFIKKVLKWEPSTKLDKGLAATFAWIKEQFYKRKAGQRVGIG